MPSTTTCCALCGARRTPPALITSAGYAGLPEQALICLDWQQCRPVTLIEADRGAFSQMRATEAIERAYVTHRSLVAPVKGGYTPG